MALTVGTSEFSTELWESALVALRDAFSKPVFEMWIKPMHLLAIDGSELSLGVHTGFAREWVETRLKSQIVETLSGVFGEAVTLRLRVLEPEEIAQLAQVSAPNRTESVPATPPESLASAPAAQVRNLDTLRSANLNVRYTFEEFVVGNSNRFAHAAAQAVASAPARAYNPLFLYGGVGLGKTHLMHAIGHRVLVDHPGANLVYVTCEKFTNEFIIALQNNKTPEFRNKYRQVDVLLIDDIQFLAGKETTQEEFFHTFNALHESGRQLIISSDRPPKEIQTLESRLRSRFEWGLLTDIQNPDIETREAILRKKAQTDRIPVPDAVTSFIARVIPSNIRELEGALIRVVAFASLSKSPITTELASEALKSLIADASVSRVTIPKIKEVVAAANGLTLKELDHPRRDARVAGPRQIAMYVATQLTNCSLPQIAREFGKKDHTTIIYARNKIKEQMMRDEAFRNRVERLIDACRR
ncbi:MAG: chromosomal replication initiator protein DnaA [Candidatus Eremiobacteraeota bacterium]|nr:chromosomal replication initiator protein DnaA [Candidatus Eremiobacteraeota bacterium]